MQCVILKVKAQSKISGFCLEPRLLLYPFIFLVCSLALLFAIKCNNTFKSSFNPAFTAPDVA